MRTARLPEWLFPSSYQRRPALPGRRRGRSSPGQFAKKHIKVFFWRCNRMQHAVAFTTTKTSQLGTDTGSPIPHSRIVDHTVSQRKTWGRNIPHPCDPLPQSPPWRVVPCYRPATSGRRRVLQLQEISTGEAVPEWRRVSARSLVEILPKSPGQNAFPVPWIGRRGRSSHVGNVRKVAWLRCCIAQDGQHYWQHCIQPHPRCLAA